MTQVQRFGRAIERQSPSLAITVVILLGGLFGVSQGLSYPLFSLILERQGVDPALIGLNSAMMPLGLIIAAPLLPLATRRFGSAATAMASTLALAAMVAGVGAVQQLWVWFPGRFVIGMAICGLYVTSETWINMLVEPGRRGRILGIFTSVLAFGFACGPFILVETGSVGWPPFLALIAIVLGTTLLIGAVYRRLPNVGAMPGGSIRAFLPLAPALLFIVLAVAAYDQGVLSLFPIYGSAKGLGERDVALAITLWASGNILFQIPIGWLSDTWSRRGTGVLLCALTIAGAAALPFAIGSRALLWPLLFVWGPASYGVYTVALIELGTRFSGAPLLAGNSAFAVMWGLGGMTGPPLFGVLMDRVGPEGLPAGLILVYAALIVTLMRRRAEA